jgi:signal transduction histidine kinase
MRTHAGLDPVHRGLDGLDVALDRCGIFNIAGRCRHRRQVERHTRKTTTGFLGQALSAFQPPFLAAGLLHEFHGALGTLLGFFIVRSMLHPVTILGAAIESTERGDPQNVGPASLPPPDTEFGRLLRGFNRMIDAVRERRELDAHLAAQERAALLGRLAATVAHEVRNPLGGMTTAVETARQYRHDPQAVDQSLSLIERGLASLAEVVNAALATYRTGGGDRRFGPADLDDLRVLVAPEARRRRIRLTWNVTVADEMPISATEIRQVLLNLLLNACAATPPDGAVLFEAERFADALHVTIRDEGPGMPPEIAQRLIAGGQGGADGGIGVGVVMQLVRNLNGRVSVISEAGAGTELQLHFPFDAGEAA